MLLVPLSTDPVVCCDATARVPATPVVDVTQSAHLQDVMSPAGTSDWTTPRSAVPAVGWHSTASSTPQINKLVLTYLLVSE